MSVFSKFLHSVIHITLTISYAENGSRRLHTPNRYPIRSYDAIAPETGLYISNNYIMKTGFIFDIDGTLTKAKDYRQSSIKLVPVNEAVKEILLALRAQGYDILIVSARSNKYRAQVFEWLSSNGIQINGMFLKEEGDKRHSSDIKSEIFEQHIIDHYDIRGVFEDDPKVMDMYKGYGIQCFEVI